MSDIIYYYNDKQYLESEFEATILTEYLLKKYGKQKTIALLKTQNADMLAKLLGKEDVGFFCQYYLTNFFVPNSASNTIRPMAKVHYDIFEELNRMFVDNHHDKEEFILSRGLGKSTFINKALSCWQHSYGLSRFTVVMGKREDDSIQFISDIKQMLKAPKIEKAFGTLVDGRTRTVNRLELELTNNTKIVAVGSGTSIRGITYGCLEGIFRPSILIADDFISEADILTDNAKEKVVNKYYKEVLEAGDKPVYRGGKLIKSGTKFIVVGTPLSSSDFINTIKNDAEFMVFQRGVCNFDVDDYFGGNQYWQQYKNILMNLKNDNRIIDAESFYQQNIEDMKFPTLWDDKYTCTYVANQYFTKRLTFMQELQCDCEGVGDIWIKYMAQMPPQEIEGRRMENTILAIDQSASNNIHSDYTAITVLGKSNGFYLVRSGELYKFDSKTEFDKYIDTVVFTLRRYKDITHVFLEKNVYKGIDATRLEERIKEDSELKIRNIKVETTYSTTNKDQRISTITDKINSGQVIFNESNKEYNNQIKDFRGAKYSLHDDAIDSLEMAINHIDEIKPHEIKTFNRNLLF